MYEVACISRFQLKMMGAFRNMPIHANPCFYTKGGKVRLPGYLAYNISHKFCMCRNYVFDEN